MKRVITVAGVALAGLAATVVVLTPAAAQAAPNPAQVLANQEAVLQRSVKTRIVLYTRALPRQYPIFVGWLGTRLRTWGWRISISVRYSDLLGRYYLIEGRHPQPCVRPVRSYSWWQNAVRQDRYALATDNLRELVKAANANTALVGLNQLAYSVRRRGGAASFRLTGGCGPIRLAAAYSGKGMR
jgi:hypothetical protein